MRLIEFIFSGFWTWLGFMFMFGIILTAVVSAADSFFGIFKKGKTDGGNHENN